MSAHIQQYSSQEEHQLGLAENVKMLKLWKIFTRKSFYCGNSFYDPQVMSEVSTTDTTDGW